VRAISEPTRLLLSAMLALLLFFKICLSGLMIEGWMDVLVLMRKDRMLVDGCVLRSAAGAQALFHGYLPGKPSHLLNRIHI
jgi:hypothetical protein